ncbi:Uncharacterised protein [Vibrio cholerae]|nr:Uncharacterised protein [Vibrio cholerae]
MIGWSYTTYTVRFAITRHKLVTIKPSFLLGTCVNSIQKYECG